MNFSDKRTIDEAARIVNSKKGGVFTIVGSDLQFRKLDSFDDKGIWFKAVCVDPRVTKAFAIPPTTIFTNGVHGVSPFLDLPYFVAISDDEKFHTVMDRKDENDNYRVFDVRNPWKPKYVDLSSVELNKDKRVLSTGFGFVTYSVVDSLMTDNASIIPVYIPCFQVIANAYKVGRDTNRSSDAPSLLLQGVFNVGNIFRFRRALPTRGLAPNTFHIQPTTGVRNGVFNQQGLWESVLPTIVPRQPRVIQL